MRLHLGGTCHVPCGVPSSKPAPLLLGLRLELILAAYSLRVCRQWRAKRKDGRGEGGAQPRLRPEEEEESENVELDEALDYKLPSGTRVSIR